jgi:dTDP-glucose 4,6-dehydratase
VRDWLYVEDHCRAIFEVLLRGAPGATFTIGGRSERKNIDIVRAICALLDELVPPAANSRLVGCAPPIASYAQLIAFVKDRPGHDRRYAIDPSLIEQTLGWTPAHSFDDGIRKTVQWYLSNRGWCERVSSGAYRRERLGLGGEG